MTLMSFGTGSVGGAETCVDEGRLLVARATALILCLLGVIARLFSFAALDALLDQFPNNLRDRTEATVGDQPNVSAEIVGEGDRCRSRLASGVGIFCHAPLRDKRGCRFITEATGLTHPSQGDLRMTESPLAYIEGTL